MSARATSDIVAVDRIGAAPGGSTGATSDGVTPGSNLSPESAWAFVEPTPTAEPPAPGPVPNSDVDSDRTPFVCPCPRGTKFGRSCTLDMGECDECVRVYCVPPATLDGARPAGPAPSWYVDRSPALLPA